MHKSMTHFILADPWPNTLMLFIFIFKQECVNNLLFSVFLVDFVLKYVQKYLYVFSILSGIYCDQDDSTYLIL